MQDVYNFLTYAKHLHYFLEGVYPATFVADLKTIRADMERIPNRRGRALTYSEEESFRQRKEGLEDLLSKHLHFPLKEHGGYLLFDSEKTLVAFVLDYAVTPNDTYSLRSLIDKYTGHPTECDKAKSLRRFVKNFNTKGSVRIWYMGNVVYCSLEDIVEVYNATIEKVYLTDEQYESLSLTDLRLNPKIYVSSPKGDIGLPVNEFGEELFFLFRGNEVEVLKLDLQNREIDHYSFKVLKVIEQEVSVTLPKSGRSQGTEANALSKLQRFLKDGRLGREVKITEKVITHEVLSPLPSQRTNRTTELRNNIEEIRKQLILDELELQRLEAEQTE